MSAVEALAEVLRDVSERHDIGAYNGSQTACSWCRTWMTNAEYRAHVAELQAAALVAAIRSMPAEQVVELIGGEVEKGVMAEVGGGVLPPHRWNNPQRVDMVQVQRPVGPWLPLGVSPETNGEQK